MIHSVILAAGKGTRMHSNLPKVLHHLSDKPLLHYVLKSAQSVSEQVHIVCGYEHENIKRHFTDKTINWVSQEKQLGTGHALMQAMPFIRDGLVLILYGDVPLVRVEMLQKLIDKAQKSDVALLTTKLDNPHGYGRIIRDKNGDVRKIIEEKDARARERNICEVHTGFFAIKANLLRIYLNQLSKENAQNELYLTDLIALLYRNNIKPIALHIPDSFEVMGVNNKIELAKLERIFQLQQAEKFMQTGLTLKDPHRFDCRGKLSFNVDCTVDINTLFIGEVSLGSRVNIGAHCVIKNTIIGDDSTIFAYSIIEGAHIKEKVSVGPFARIRAHSILAAESKIGNFVEIKKSHIGEQSKINHLSYIGDSKIGTQVNVGAGVITCNYDGANKHQTKIGDRAFIGSGSELVAPIDIGEDATIGAGSTITKDVPKKTLTLTRIKQSSLKNWQKPIKNNKDLHQ